MGIGATDAKGADPGSPWIWSRFPWGGLEIDHKGTVLKINFGIGGLIKEGGGNETVLQDQDGFDKSRNTRCNLQVADIGLH